MNDVIIAPSILSADFSKLGEEIETVGKLGARWLHFDVMDGHFVDNISFGLPVLRSVARTHYMVNDVHIMISEPKKYAVKFIKNGADILTFHYEACQDDKEVFEIIDMIHDAGAKAGLSIKPETPIEKVLPFIFSLDVILLMSVEPGFGGQDFIMETLNKISFLKNYFKTNEVHHKCIIEVDGGINLETAKKAKEAGADALVVGSYLFGHEDIEERFNNLKK